MKSAAESMIIEDLVVRNVISRVRAISLAHLYDRLSDFAKSNNLVLIMQKCDLISCVGLKFYNGMNTEINYTYLLEPGFVSDFDDEFEKIVRYVSRHLLHNDEDSVRTVSISDMVDQWKKSYEDIAELRRQFEIMNATKPDTNANILGLTKQEHIALELTKTWASTTVRKYYDSEDIVGRYYEMLEEVERRAKAESK